MLVTLFGTPFICHQQGSLSDVGMPPTWEKGSHLPPGTTKLGKLRDSHNSATAPTAKPDLESSSLLGCQGCQKCDSSVGVHRYTRWTGRLSHRTRNYPALTICCQRVVIHASLNTRFKGMQVVTYLATIK